MLSPVLALAKFHLRKNMFSKGYLFVLLSLPFFMLVIVGFGKLMDSAENKTVRIGLVGDNNFFQELSLDDKDDVEIVLYPNGDDARKALDVGDIAAYYLFPANYPTSQKTNLFYYDAPSWSTQNYVQNVVRVNLMRDYPRSKVDRVISSPSVTLHSINTQKTFAGGGPTTGDFAPMAVAVLFIFSLFPISDMLIGALGDEKANRTVEVIMTSISPTDLMFGKIIAVFIMVVVEVSVWLGMILLSVWIGGSLLAVEWLQNIRVVWVDVAKISVLAVAGIVFYCAFLIFAGTFLSQVEDVRQASSLVILPLFAPLYVLPVLIENPNSTLGTVFALLPFTSVQTMGVQILFISISFAKVLASLGVSIVSTILVAWLASRSFRISMLRYGKRIRIVELFSQRGSHV